MFYRIHFLSLSLSLSLVGQSLPLFAFYVVSWPGLGQVLSYVGGRPKALSIPERPIYNFSSLFWVKITGLTFLFLFLSQQTQHTAILSFFFTVKHANCINVFVKDPIGLADPKSIRSRYAICQILGIWHIKPQNMSFMRCFTSYIFL